MEYSLIVVIFLLSAIGIIALNDSGAYTQSVKSRAIGLLTNVAAMLLTMWLFGTLRGLFIYMGIISLLGMLYPLLTYSKPTHNKP